MAPARTDTSTVCGGRAQARQGRGNTRVRRWMAGVSLRNRLTFAVVALSALMFLIVGPLWLLLLHQYLIGQHDQQLRLARQRAAAVYVHDQQARPPGTASVSRFLRLPGQADGTLAALIVAGQAVQAGRSDTDGAPRALGWAETQALEREPPEQVPFTSEVGSLGHYRLITEPLPGEGVMVVGLPLHELNDTISRLAGIVSLVALAGVVLAGPASAAVTQAALRPLRRLAAAATWVTQLTAERGEVPLAARVTAARAADADPRTEVGQVGVALNAMIEHVNAALETRQAGEAKARSFLADAGHELRAPLSTIRRYTELAGRAGDDLPDGLREVLERIGAQTDRMSSLVDDMLLLARIDAGRPLSRERVDLPQLLADTIRDAHAAGPGHQWELTLPPHEVEILGDAARLTQVVSNLMTNARVHTPPGTTVRVALTDHPAELVVTVVDDGPGIPADLLPQVFGRFARGDTSRSRAAGSTGLGLAIAHAVVTEHAGTINVRSEAGHTAFTMRLPKAGVADQLRDPGAEPVHQLDS